MRDLLDSFRRLEGGLIEFYVLGTCVDDWRWFVHYLRSAGMLSSLTLEGEPVESNISATVFEDQEFDSYLLTATIAGGLWTSNMSTSTVIDMQGDPREFNDVSQVLVLSEFLEHVAKKMEKDVILIPESVNPLAVRPLLAFRKGRISG